MNYIKITKHDIANGSGIRVVLWVSGCSMHCNQCHNRQTWDKNKGQEFTEETMHELIEALNKPYISGITYSGGHPLEDYNIDAITKIASTINKVLPHKTQWLYTGYEFNEIIKMPKCRDLLKYLDVIVDGKYDYTKRDISLKFRGSSNQNIWKKLKRSDFKKDHINTLPYTKAEYWVIDNGNI